MSERIENLIRITAGDITGAIVSMLRWSDAQEHDEAFYSILFIVHPWLEAYERQATTRRRYHPHVTQEELN